MLDQLRSRQARRMFLVVCVLSTVVALGASYLVHNLLVNSPRSATLLTLNDLLAGIVSGSVTAGFLAILASWLLVKEEQLTTVQLLDPLETRRRHRMALERTDFWYHYGHIGGWSVKEAIPALAASAKHEVDLTGW